jgi:hypothetical protein
VKLHVPVGSAVVVPSTLVPFLMVTVRPASAVPLRMSLLVTWSVVELPVSEARTSVTVGAVVSRVNAMVVDPVLPARSVSDAVRL